MGFNLEFEFTLAGIENADAWLGQTFIQRAIKGDLSKEIRDCKIEFQLRDPEDGLLKRVRLERRVTRQDTFFAYINNHLRLDQGAKPDPRDATDLQRTLDVFYDSSRHLMERLLKKMMAPLAGQLPTPTQRRPVTTDGFEDDDLRWRLTLEFAMEPSATDSNRLTDAWGGLCGLLADMSDDDERLFRDAARRRPLFGSS